MNGTLVRELSQRSVASTSQQATIADSGDARHNALLRAGLGLGGLHPILIWSKKDFESTFLKNRVTRKQ